MGTVCKVSLLIGPNLNPTADFFISGFPFQISYMDSFFCFFYRVEKYMNVFLHFFSCVVWDDAKTWCLETSVENTAQTGYILDCRLELPRCVSSSWVSELQKL